MFGKILDLILGPKFPQLLTRVNVRIYANHEEHLEPFQGMALEQYLGSAVFHIYDEVTERGVRFLPRRHRGCMKKTIAFLGGNPEVPFAWVGHNECDGYYLAEAGSVCGIQIGFRSTKDIVGPLEQYGENLERAEKKFKRYILAALIILANGAIGKLSGSDFATEIAEYYFPPKNY